MKGATAADELAPGLYLVATPIGNLNDITLRALAVLRGVNLVLAEDTRRTRKLLSHFDIRARLQSLHAHNEAARAPRLAERLAAGERMALVSDAGTPLISDPGHELVRAALAAGVAVIPVPGPSAVLAALMASGLPLDRFTFAGYLPRKRGPRGRLFASLASDPGTLVFLESPRRLARSLADATRVLGARPAVVARELTKVHEELVRGTLPEVAARFAEGEVRGEVVVCIGGSGKLAVDAAEHPAAAAGALDREALRCRFEELLADGATRNDALKQIATEQGLKRRDIYTFLMVES